MVLEKPPFVKSDLDPGAVYPYNLPMNFYGGPAWRDLLLCAFLGLGIFAFIGCSKGQVKLSETGHQIQKIDSFLLTLQESYSKKDLTNLKSYFSQNFLDQHPELFEAIGRNLEGIAQVRMDLTVDLIHIDGQKVKVLLHWDVNAVSVQGAHQHRGNATLQLLEQENLQITALEGDNPFSWAVPPTN